MIQRKHINILQEAASSIIRSKGRSIVLLSCLIGVLLPFITAIAISEGIRLQSNIAIASGADLYISSEQYGRNGPVSLTYIQQIENIPGVTKVRPRIVGRTYIGDEPVVVLGIDSDKKIAVQSGEKQLEPGQALFGASLAKTFALKPGDQFRFTLFPTKPFINSGILEPQLSIWSSVMVIITFADAEEIFMRPGYGSELLVYCRPGMAEQVGDQISSFVRPWDMKPSLRVQTKQLVERYVNTGFDTQAGVFSMFYVIAFGIAIPAILLLSGFGHGDRRREIGIMKATGWQTLEVLEMSFFVNTLLALTGSLLTLFLAFIWLKLFNGAGIAPLFLSGIDWVPDFTVPTRFTPLPFLLSFLFGLVLTLLGTIIPTWKAAITPPMMTMK